MRTAPALAALAFTLASCGPGAPEGAPEAGPGGEGGAPVRPAAAETVAYAVEGMHCNGCADAIVAEVSEVRGVRSVRCTFESKVAVIEFDAPARPEAERAMTKMGYKIRPVPLPQGAAAPGPAVAPGPGVAPAPAAGPAGQPADSR
jgi:copper chaperone CopZ